MACWSSGNYVATASPQPCEAAPFFATITPHIARGIVAMVEPHVVSAVKDKRAEVFRIIADLEKRVTQHRADMVRIDATLRLFPPGLAACVADEAAAPGARRVPRVPVEDI
jgi:hypothetical protein